MGRSSLTRILLLCLLLLLFSNNGFGRKLSIREDHSIAAASELQEKSREMYELDYEGAGPNKNGRSVGLLPDQPSPTPPPPPPPPPPESGY